MKITGIEIEQFGPLQSLSLTWPAAGVTVVQGPNESGKTALRRFIRGVLFGFPPDDTSGIGPRCRDRHVAGSLRIEHRGRMAEIHRSATNGSAGIVTTRWLSAAPTSIASHSLIKHCDWETADNTPCESEVDGATDTLPLCDALPDILGDLTETMFDQLLSLGRRELHDLNCLNDAEVARLVFGESLGPFGQTLLNAADETADDIARHWDDSRPDALPALLARHEQLEAQIQSHAGQLERYQELIRQRSHHEQRLTELQSKRAHLQGQLRGYTQIERVWHPWQRLRDLRAELQQLPRVDDFPEGGLARFDQIEHDLLTALKCRETLLSEADQFRCDAQAIAIPRELRDAAPALRELLEQREQITQLETRSEQAQAAVNLQQARLDEQLPALGHDWSLERLEMLDTSVAAHHRLVEKARQFRRAVAQKNKWHRRLLRLSQSCQRSQLEIDQALKALGGGTLEDALRQARQARATRLHDAPIARVITLGPGGDPDIEHLRLRIIELEQRRVSISQQIERLEPQLILPPWVLWVLGFFAVVGLALAIIGIATGFATNALAGAAYTLLGTACGGLALSLKTQFEQQVRGSILALHQELRANESRLAEARDSWRRLTDTEPNFSMATRCTGVGSCLPIGLHTANHSEIPSGRPATVSRPGPAESNFLSVEDLERLLGVQRHLARRQARRLIYRERFDAAARDVTAARQAWCDTLRQLGLPESVQIADTFNLWQQLAAANERRIALRSAAAFAQQQRETVQATRSRITALLRRLHRNDFVQSATGEIFADWERDLNNLSETLKARRQLRREEHRRRAEAAKYREEIDELRQQRSALLRQACATDRSDYARRAAIVSRIESLQRQIVGAKSELDHVAQAVPDLAIVEDDLLHFNNSQHATRLTQLRREADETEHELARLNSELENAYREIEQLETDDTASNLRQERELVSSQLRSMTDSWLADEWTRQSLDGIRERYERVSQPGILSAASCYLSRLTEGRYCTLWTPLRHRTLLVDDSAGQIWRQHQLSSSTRDLLLLAIRLAVLDELHRRGIDHPLLLDDAFLTFDLARSTRTVQEIAQFAQQGIQVLALTSQPEISAAFTSAGGVLLRLCQSARNSHRLAG